MNPNINTNRKPEGKSFRTEEKAIDLNSKQVLGKKRTLELMLFSAFLVIVLLLSSCSQEDGMSTQTTSANADMTTELPAIETSESSAAQSEETSDPTKNITTETTAAESIDEGAVRELITPDDAKELLESDSEVLLLDVRTEAEYLELRIPGSTLLPVGELEDRIDEIAEWKDKTIVIYCRSGNRSSQAADILQEKGFMTIYDLGGIIDWTYETESGSE